MGEGDAVITGDAGRKSVSLMAEQLSAHRQSGIAKVDVELRKLERALAGSLGGEADHESSGMAHTALERPSTSGSRLEPPLTDQAALAMAAADQEIRRISRMLCY